MTTPNNPQINLNLFTNNPTTTDLLNLLKKEIMFDLNSHHLATIQSFNPANQTCTASINYMKTFFNLNSDGTYTSNLVSYPLLLDVPVIVLGGGGANLTFPVKQGDQAVILFNDRSIDSWFQSGQVGALTSSRAHSLSDGLALIGLNSMNSPIENYDMTQAVLRMGAFGVGVSTSKVTIFNDSTTLNTIMQNILTQLEALANSVCSNGSPIAPAVATELATLASQLGELIG